MRNSLNIRNISGLKVQHFWKQKARRCHSVVCTISSIVFFFLWFSQLGIEKYFCKSTQNIVSVENVIATEAAQVGMF